MVLESLIFKSLNLQRVFNLRPQWAGFWEPEGSKYISFLLHISFMVPSLTPLETTFSSSFVSLTLLSGRARTTSPPSSKFFISAQAETSVSEIELMNLSMHPPSPFQLLLGRAMLGLVPPVGYGSPLLLQTDHICYRKNRTRPLKRHRFLSRGLSFFSKIFLGGRYFFKILSISCHIPIFQFPTVI